MSLAAQLEATAAHMTLVRAEYDRTVIDHSHVDGCDDCGVGADPDRLAGWIFINGHFLCGTCAFQALRETRPDALTACVNGHDLTKPGATFERPAAGGRTRTACLQCRRDRSTKSTAKRRLKRRAARAAS